MPPASSHPPDRPVTPHAPRETMPARQRPPSLVCHSAAPDLPWPANERARFARRREPLRRPSKRLDIARRPRRSSTARDAPEARDRRWLQPNPSPECAEARRARALQAACSTISTRQPLNPKASTFARSSIMARVSASESGRPSPQAWLRTRFNCRLFSSEGGIRTSANFPNPVLMPYTARS